MSKFHRCCSCIICKNTITVQTLKEHYNTHTKIKFCSYCNTQIKHTLKFCNHSCSAKYNNIRRSPEILNTQKTSIRLHYANKITINKTPQTCVICSNIFTYRILKKTCSSMCRIELIKQSFQGLNHVENGRVGGKKSASIRTLRSKAEIKLFELISSINNDAISNHIIVDGWDADIVVPSTKTAILWNGPWHYKEMNIGSHSLKQVQTRDSIKVKLFTQLGWNVVIYEDRYYTPESAFEHYISMS